MNARNPEVLGSILGTAAYIPRAYQASHSSKIDKLVPASAGVKSYLYDHGVVSVGLLLAPLHSSFCSWSVNCEAGSSYFVCESRYIKNRNFELLKIACIRD